MTKKNAVHQTNRPRFEKPVRCQEKHKAVLCALCSESRCKLRDLERDYLATLAHEAYQDKEDLILRLSR